MVQWKLTYIHQKSNFQSFIPENMLKSKMTSTRQKEERTNYCKYMYLRTLLGSVCTISTRRFSLVIFLISLLVNDPSAKSTTRGSLVSLSNLRLLVLPFQGWWLLLLAPGPRIQARQKASAGCFDKVMAGAASSSMSYHCWRPRKIIYMAPHTDSATEDT